jgi:soluble lytic murein transglycosylase-like protein
MPKYAQSFADLCNLGQLGKDDETDPILNLSLGACLFQHLLDTHKSNILALAAYNAGSASSSVASLKQLGNPVPETAAYVAKATYLKEKVEGKERD